MTVTNSTRSITYNGDGSTTVFAVSFYFLEDDDLVVTLVDASGTDIPQAITTDYTVSGAGNLAGGSVTMLTSPAVGERLRIERFVDLLQQIDYVENTKFPAETQERALDKAYMALQQQKADIDRAPKFTETSEITDLTFPSPEANQVIRWNGDGTGLVNGLGDAPVDSVNGQIGTVVLDADDIDDSATANKFTTAADITKLAGIEAGAQVNTVDSVFGRTGAVVGQAGDYDDGQVTAAGTATNYTPAAATVEGHLAGVDTALGDVVSDVFNATYTPGYLAMTSRTLQNVLDGRPVTPMDFGAVGDNATDDTLALQDAFDFWLSTTEVATLDLAGRTYVVSSKLGVPAVNFFEKRLTNGILRAASSFVATDYMLDFSTGLVGNINNLTIDNMELRGGDSGIAAYAAGGILMATTQGANIAHNTIQRFTEAGIKCTDNTAANEIRISHNQISGQAQVNPNVRGIDLAGNDSDIHYNVVRECKVPIYLREGGNSVIGNHWYNFNSPKEYGLVCLQAVRMQINDNYVDGLAIQLQDPSNVNMTGNKFILQDHNEWPVGHAFIEIFPQSAGFSLADLTITGNDFFCNLNGPANSLGVNSTLGTINAGGTDRCFMTNNTFNNVTARTTHPRRKVAFAATATGTANFNTGTPLIPFGSTRQIVGMAQEITSGTGAAMWHSTPSSNQSTITTASNITGSVMVTGTVNNGNY